VLTQESAVSPTTAEPAGGYGDGWTDITQIPKRETAMFEYTRALTSFSVDDVPKAQAFYGETLGLKSTGQDGVLVLHLADGNDTLVYPKPDHIPASYTVLNFVVEDIDEAVDRLGARGVRFLRYDEHRTDDKGVVRSPDRDIAWFADPAGNVHSVVQMKAPLPVAGAS
jgi:catechol 2,3-dioxygenase-like lactoylglutathione lyase family enzyme